jgi:ribokinase
MDTSNHTINKEFFMIIVFGALNIEMSLELPNLPTRSKSVCTESYTTVPGGKAAKQSYAIARMNEKVAVIGMVGDDGMGYRLKTKLRRSGVITSGIGESEVLPTGCVIKLNASKDNSEIYAQGANKEISTDQLPDRSFNDSSLLLLQLEIDLRVVEQVVKMASQRDVPIMLNAAPYSALPLKTIKSLDYLIISEKDVDKLSQDLNISETSYVDRLKAISRKTKIVLIALSGDHAQIASINMDETLKVQSDICDEIIRKIGGDDAFCGVFAACIHKGYSLEVATRYGLIARTLSCRDDGSMDSFPFEEAVELEVKKEYETDSI